VRVLDLRIDDPTLLPALLREFRPDVVGVTSMTTDCYQARAVLHMARHWSPDVLTVVGGHLGPDLPLQAGGAGRR
jgi:B12 binding domain